MATNTNQELRRQLLTARQRLVNRRLHPELRPSWPGPGIQTKPLRRQTSENPLMRHLMSPEQARAMLRLRRRQERQNRRRSR